MSDFKDSNQRYTLRDILRSPDRKRGEAGNALTYLFRNILFTNRVTVEDWELMLNRYFLAVYGDDRKTAIQEKINFSRSISKDRMTWGRFQMALEVFGYDETEFAITLRNRGEGAASKSYKVNIRNRHKVVRTALPSDADKHNQTPLVEEREDDDV